VSTDDYYAVLGVSEVIDDAELRRVWRRLALDLHPDRAGPGTTEQFARISAAYAVLSDPEARTAYDRWRGTGIKHPSSPMVGPRAPGVLLQRLSAPLNALLMRGIAQWAEGDMIDLYVNGEEAATGGMVTIPMRVQVRCPACAGDATKLCVRCDGQRTVEDLFAAWLAVRPGVADGTILTPSAWLPGMVHPVYFRVRLASA
jgi:DnaJ-class molecular chaperone